MKFPTKTAKDFYKKFKKENKDVPYVMYKEVLSEFNKLMVDEIIYNANVLNLGGNLGKINIRKVERRATSPRIDYANCERDENNNITKYVYFTDNYYLRFFWYKPETSFKLTNIYDYKFQMNTGPNKGATNNRYKLSKAVQDNPILAYKYDKSRKIKEVQLIDPKTNIVLKTFPSYIDAAKYISKDSYNVKAINIKRAVDNDNATAYKYKWRTVFE